MDITIISDTHAKHSQLNLPGGDLLIHAGDISTRGNLYELEIFLLWFVKQPYEYKVFIAGNHDFCFQDDSYGCRKIIKELTDGSVIYLQDSGCEINGYNIWGSPWQPEFYNWAFNLPRGIKLKERWDLIPKDTDILITHGPPNKILDLTSRDNINVGCNELYNRIKTIKPIMHIFGHIHEGYGILEEDGIKFINASSLNRKYQCVNSPIQIKI